MIDEKKKMTTQDSSVMQMMAVSSQNSDISITTSKGEINDEVVNHQESPKKCTGYIMSEPAYLHCNSGQADDKCVWGKVCSD